MAGSGRSLDLQLFRRFEKPDWVLVKGFYINYHNKETLLHIKDPYCGHFNY